MKQETAIQVIAILLVIVLPLLIASQFGGADSVLGNIIFWVLFVAGGVLWVKAFAR